MIESLPGDQNADTKQNKSIREKDKVPFHLEMTVGIKSV